MTYCSLLELFDHEPPNECDDADVFTWHNHIPCHIAILPQHTHTVTDSASTARSIVIMSFRRQGSGPGGSRALNESENRFVNAPMIIYHSHSYIQPPIYSSSKKLAHQIHLQQRQFLIQKQQLHFKQELFSEHEKNLQLLEQKIWAGIPLPRIPLANLPISGNKQKPSSRRPWGLKMKTNSMHTPKWPKPLRLILSKTGASTTPSKHGYCKATHCLDLCLSVQRLLGTHNPTLSKMKAAANKSEKEMIDSALLAIAQWVY